MKLTAKRSFVFQNVMCRKGETIELHDHYAAELLKLGLVEKAKADTSGSSELDVQPNFASMVTKPSRAKRETKPANLTGLETK